MAVWGFRERLPLSGRRCRLTDGAASRTFDAMLSVIKNTLFLSFALVACASPPETPTPRERRACDPGTDDGLEYSALPIREGPRVETTGTVPHVQLAPGSPIDVVDEMHRRLDQLPDVSKRVSVRSLAGAIGIWIDEDVQFERPECAVGEREFAHLHPDGSFHVSLSPARIPAAVEAGWAERHPSSFTNPAMAPYVMLFAPRTADEADVTIQLVVDSYNFLTGRHYELSRSR